MEMLEKGEGLLFTFKSEAEEFATRNKLNITLIDEDLTDDKHFEVKGYKGGLYWVAE